MKTIVLTFITVLISAFLAVPSVRAAQWGGNAVTDESNAAGSQRALVINKPNAVKKVCKKGLMQSL